jgi:pimeloyl-ACP methyl ester carboxylesterase
MRATLNGIEVGYTDEGKGPALVLVHGFPLNRRVWDRQVEAFKSTHRVIAPDLRGFGETEATGGPVSMGRFAEDLFALMQHLKVGPVTFVGHSMGGYVALAFATAFPQALQGLVLVCTKSGADAAEAAAARRALAERVPEEGVAIVVDAMAPKMLSASNTDAAMAAEVRGFMLPSKPKGVIGALLGMAERTDMGTWLGQLRVPTLVVTGAADTLIPPSESEALAKAIPSAQLDIIPDGGHLVAFEHADAFNEVLSVWLAAHGL